MNVLNRGMVRSEFTSPFDISIGFDALRTRRSYKRKKKTGGLV